MEGDKFNDRAPGIGRCGSERFRQGSSRAGSERLTALLIPAPLGVTDHLLASLSVSAIDPHDAVATTPMSLPGPRMSFLGPVLASLGRSARRLLTGLAGARAASRTCVGTRESS